MRIPDGPLPVCAAEALPLIARATAHGTAGQSRKAGFRKSLSADLSLLSRCVATGYTAAQFFSRRTKWGDDR